MPVYRLFAHSQSSFVSNIANTQLPEPVIVTPSGEKFCRLFGMSRVTGSSHNSSLYEITMIPPKFRVLSKKSKVLHDYYLKKYEEAPYLFEE